MIRLQSRPFHRVSRWTVGALLVISALTFASAQTVPQSDAETERFARVSDILKALDAKPGARIADIGAGDGFYTVRIARAVLPGGQALGEDIDDAALQKLRARVTTEQATNVEVVVGAVDDPHLPSEALDAVLVHNAYHEFVQYEQMLAHILKALKPGGRFVLVEPFHESARGLPREKQVANHDLAPDFGESELRAAGFTILQRDNEFVKFIGQPGGFWMIVARK
ncbi:MAG TPA: class I SAM-dependent methyltransferase [Vicinamibacterales bacterium]|nr:class I SAM-dependent methyltransferase [Vicinamibacterales bacterium]